MVHSPRHSLDCDHPHKQAFNSLGHVAVEGKKVNTDVQTDTSFYLEGDRQRESVRVRARIHMT